MSETPIPKWMNVGKSVNKWEAEQRELSAHPPTETQDGRGAFAGAIGWAHPVAIYADDVRELLERMEDDLGPLSDKLSECVKRHALAIMHENSGGHDDK